MSTKPDSGTLVCDGDVIRYSSRDFGSWSLPISSLQIIGEYTNENGPFLDDYFFVFLTESRSEWWEASFYAKGSDTFLATLRKNLTDLGSPELYGSTSFKSRILWPAKHSGKPLFVFSQRSHAPGVLCKVLKALDFKMEQRLVEGLD